MFIRFVISVSVFMFIFYIYFIHIYMLSLYVSIHSKRKLILVNYLDSSIYAHYVFKAFDVNSNGAISFRVSFRFRIFFHFFFYFFFIFVDALFVIVVRALFLHISHPFHFLSQ